MSDKFIKQNEQDDREIKLYTKYDILAIVILSTISLYIIFYDTVYKRFILNYTHTHSKKVVYKILVFGNDRKIISLDKSPPNLKLELDGQFGKTIIEWDKNGRVRIASSPCKNKICVHTGWIQPPMFTFCVPNGIGIQCEYDEKDFDGITQ